MGYSLSILSLLSLLSPLFQVFQISAIDRTNKLRGMVKRLWGKTPLCKQSAIQKSVIFLEDRQAQIRSKACLNSDFKGCTWSGIEVLMRSACERLTETHAESSKRVWKYLSQWSAWRPFRAFSGVPESHLQGQRKCPGPTLSRSWSESPRTFWGQLGSPCPAIWRL